METFYALIDITHRLHFGYTFDEELAKTEATQIENQLGCKIDIYEFRPHDEFEKED